MIEQVTYRAFCSNEECDYVVNKSWAFKPSYIDSEVCPRCQSAFDVRQVEYTQSTSASAGIINNRGELHTRLSSDFRDLMQKIKDGSPHCNMRDFK